MPQLSAPLPQALQDLNRDIRNTLQGLMDLGFSGTHCSPETLSLLNAWAAPPSPASFQPRPNDTLESIQQEMVGCHKCRLGQDRPHLIFGYGSPTAVIMIIGDFPETEEYRSGKLFSGPAGQLLVKIIKAAKLTSQTVYVSNILKCRPIANGELKSIEIRTCFQFLRRQIQVIAPKIICTMGPLPARILLNTHEPLTDLRGRFHNYNGIKVMPTYSPEHLLKDPADKRAVWEDIQKVMGAVGIS